MSTRAGRNKAVPLYPHCQAKVRGTGKLCRAKPIHGTKFCNCHTENRASLLGKLGGHPRLQFDVSKLKKINPATDSAAVRNLMAQRIYEIEQGLLEPELGTKLFYCYSILMKACETVSLEQLQAEFETFKKERG